MTIFGWRVYTARYRRKDQEDTFVPWFGFSAWTFNNPFYRSLNNQSYGDPKRRVIGRRKGLYLHLWLFSNRFDLDFDRNFLYE